ncbi:hypothetical protein JYT87_00450 [Nitrospira defluvii]|nr:hypothetical protein [Nitrospira defluvii]
MDRLTFRGFLLSGLGGSLFFLIPTHGWHFIVLCGVSLGWGFLLKRATLSVSDVKRDFKENLNDRQTEILEPAKSNGDLAQAPPDHLFLIERFNEEYKGMKSELTQIDGLLHDAIEQLMVNFKSLEGDTKHQAKLIEDLDADSSAAQEESYRTINFEMFINKTEQLLGAFVESVVNISKNSMKLVEELEEISNAIKSILGDVEGVDAIAEQTKVLAINATIEAARAGEAGKGFAVVANEVRQLVQRSKSFGQGITERVSEVEEALLKAESSTQDIASQDLNFALSAKNDSDEMMEKIVILNRKREESMNTITQINANIKLNVDNAVTVLQFEDLSTQLIGKIFSRVDLMKNILSGLERDIPMEVFSEMKQEKGPSVVQEDMEAGEVELF